MRIDDEILSITSEFDRVAKTRDSNHPCTKLYCTTCGGVAAHIERNLEPRINNKIDRLLKKASSRDISKFGRWRDLIIWSLASEYKYILRRELMEKRQRLDLQDVRKMDRYIFDARKLLPIEDTDYRSVISNGIELALKSEDSSLIETLIIVLEEKSANYPDLIKLAKEKSKTDIQLKKVLYNKLREIKKDLRDYVGDGTTIDYYLDSIWW